MLRFHPAIKLIHELLKQQIIGSVFNGRFEFGSFLPSWHPYEDYKLSYASVANLGGGVINTISHDLDLVLYLFGEPISVKSVKQNVGFLDIEVEEQSETILFIKIN